MIQEAARRQNAARQAVDQLSGAFKADPFEFATKADLRSHLHHLLAADPVFTSEEVPDSFSVVREEYATPFKCHMGDLRFEVLDDHALGARRDYDLVVLNPWWMERAPVQAFQNDDFEVFRRDIRDKAQEDDPPLCLVGIEIHLVRTERPRKADYDAVLRDYRKLLLSGQLSNGWRFMDHRYMLVYSQHSQPHEAKWRELVQAAWERDVDPKNAWVAWISPRGIRWSG